WGNRGKAKWVRSIARLSSLAVVRSRGGPRPGAEGLPGRGGTPFLQVLAEIEENPEFAAVVGEFLEEAADPGALEAEHDQIEVVGVHLHLRVRAGDFGCEHRPGLGLQQSPAPGFGLRWGWRCRRQTVGRGVVGLAVGELDCPDAAGIESRNQVVE